MNPEETNIIQKTFEHPTLHIQRQTRITVLMKQEECCEKGEI